MAGILGDASQRLAWILDADPSRAVAGFKQVGDSAEKDLKRADAASANSGRGLQVFGAGAVAFAAVAGKALFDFAGKAEEAQFVSIKLENSVENSGGKAGDSVKPYEDLAMAIEHNTAASHLDIEAGESRLIQMGLTQDQVKETIPLVTDLARKYGIDLDTAAKLVGKSVDGSSGALARQGVIVDKTAFATDHYGATITALRNSVGGFATQEGATFSGRMERLGNEFSDLEENVGVGVVKAFEHFADAGESVIGVFDKLSPGMSSNIGEWATYGVAALGAVGALSFGIGTIERMSGRLETLKGWLGVTKTATEEDTGAKEANTAATEGQAVAQGEAAGSAEVLAAADATATGANEALAVSEEEATVAAEGMSVAMGVGLVVAAAAVGAALIHASQNAEQFSIDAKSFLGASNQAVDDFINNVVPQMHRWGQSNEDIAKELLSQSVPAAEKFADALDRQGQSSDKVRQLIDQKKQSDITASKAEQAYSKDVQGATDATEANAQAHKDAVQAITDETNAVKASFDPLFGMVNAQNANTKAEADAKASKDAVFYTQVAYNNAVRQFGPNSQQAQDASAALSKATQDMTDKNYAAGQSALNLQTAAIQLAGAIRDGDVTLQQATWQLQVWVGQGIITQEQADQLRWSFAQAAGAADTIHGTATLDANPALMSLDELNTRIAYSKQHILDLAGTILGLPAGTVHSAIGRSDLPQGLSTINEQGPETVLRVGNTLSVIPSVGRESLHPAGGSGGGGVNFNGPVTFAGSNAAEIVDELDWKVRTGRLRGAAA